MNCEPLVSVIVLAYNQEATVAQTLDCIIGQERSFPIEIIIGEDASQDGTRAVCEEYAARYPYIGLMAAAPNKGILRNYLDCLAECRGRYVAGCAGDDFWHDPLKLKKQTDFLEANPDYGVVHSDKAHLDVNTGQTTCLNLHNPPQGRITDEVYMRHIVHAPTVCYRRSLTEHIDFDEWIAAGFMMEDLPMWIELARYTKFKYFPECTVTYRTGHVSASQGGDIEKRLRFVQNAFDVKLYFYDKYHPAIPRSKIVNKRRRHIIRMIVTDGEWRLFWRKARELGLGYSLLMALHTKFRNIGKKKK